ncbi:MAG: flagellar biosynthesis anti-sigma factor FlgM [Rhodoferax sp.]|nr:flagellar biosynthesis anti-sigma factor FlgM [Rhodoferax sp.]
MLKVSGYTPPDLPAPKTAPPKTEPNAAQTATSAAADPGVAVVITSTAKSMGKDAVNSTSDIDSNKVEAMKAAIQDGSFTVNPEAIADKLLSNAQEMFRTTLK